MRTIALLFVIAFLLGCNREPITYTVFAPGYDGNTTIYEHMTKGQEGSTWCAFKKDGKEHIFVGTFTFIEE